MDLIIVWKGCGEEHSFGKDVEGDVLNEFSDLGS